jgi:hypothetical protein
MADGGSRRYAKALGIVCLVGTMAAAAAPRQPVGSSPVPVERRLAATTATKLDAERPTVSITAPATGATVSATVTVTAAASDNVGVAGVRFYVDAVALGAERAAPPYEVSWNTVVSGNGSHRLTAIARDTAGNLAKSEPVTVQAFNVASGRVEDTDASVSYTAGWEQDTSRSWSAVTAMITRTAGAQATLTFSGRSANWIGGRGPQTGIARVYVDGVFRTEVDTFSPGSEEIRVPMFTVNDLADTAHTLTIEATGLKNAGASDALIVVDAFDVPAVSVSRLQETDSAVAYAGGWTQGDTARAWSEGYAALSTVPGARATLTFSGTAVRWIGARSPQTGTAAVYLDGTHVADVDTYASYEQIQAEMFTSGDLANGTHTLAIQATGGQNAQSSSPLIVVDGFDVTVPGRRYQDTDVAITYAPAENWYLDTRDHAYSEGTEAEAIYAGSTATFPFTGTGVSFVSGTCSRCGIIRVAIDGGAATEIDLYAPTDAPQKTVFSAAGLAAGNHTVTVEVTGEKNPLSVYYWVVVDAFDVIP